MFGERYWGTTCYLGWRSAGPDKPQRAAPGCAAAGTASTQLRCSGAVGVCVSCRIFRSRSGCSPAGPGSRCRVRPLPRCGSRWWPSARSGCDGWLPGSPGAAEPPHPVGPRSRRWCRCRARSGWVWPATTASAAPRWWGRACAPTGRSSGWLTAAALPAWRRPRWCGREGQAVRDGHRVWRVAGLHVVGEPGQDVFGMIEFVSQAAAHTQIVGDHLLQPSHATSPAVGHGRASPASLRWSVLA